MLKFKKFGLLILIPLITLIIFSCDKKPTGPSEDTEIVLNENVKVVEDAELNEITGVTENTITFSSAGEGFEIGDIIVGGISEKTPQGFLRKITGVTLKKTDGTTGVIEYATKMVSLAELIKEGRLEFDKEIFSIDHPRKTYEVYEGVNISPKYNLTGRLSGFIHVSVGDIKTQLTLKLNGKVDVKLLAEIHKDLNKKYPVFEIKTDPIVIPTPVPIVVTPIIKGYIKLEGRVDGVFKTTITEEVEIASTISYDDEWKGTLDPKNKFSITETEVNFSTNMKVKLGTTVDLIIYEIIGPRYGLEPYGRLDVNTQRNPWWRFYAGADVLLGITPGVLIPSWMWSDPKEWLIEGPEALIAQAEPRANTPPTASFTVTPSSGATTTPFSFNAHSCSDNEDSNSSLQVRWDWENDGTWDTGFSVNKSWTRTYSTSGAKTIKLEVKDTGGLTATTTKQISVAENAPLPDLIFESVTITNIDTNYVNNGKTLVLINFDYVIKNIGNAPVNLDGETSEECDNLSLQSFFSRDQIFYNEDDLAAGGSIIGLSPLGFLYPGETYKGSWGANGQKSEIMDYPYLIIKIDFLHSSGGYIPEGNVDESNEDNNYWIIEY